MVLTIINNIEFLGIFFVNIIMEHKPFYDIYYTKKKIYIIKLLFILNYSINDYFFNNNI